MTTTDHRPRSTRLALFGIVPEDIVAEEYDPEGGGIGLRLAPYPQNVEVHDTLAGLQSIVTACQAQLDKIRVARDLAAEAADQDAAECDRLGAEADAQQSSEAYAAWATNADGTPF
jgi:hypothetical protein